MLPFLASTYLGPCLYTMILFCTTGTAVLDYCDSSSDAVHKAALQISGPALVAATLSGFRVKRGNIWVLPQCIVLLLPFTGATLIEFATCLARTRSACRSLCQQSDAEPLMPATNDTKSKGIVLKNKHCIASVSQGLTCKYACM